MLKTKNSSFQEKVLKWYVAVTKYRNEKAVAKRLDEQGIESFLPLIKNVRQYASRKKVHYVPLISCYIFVKIALKDIGKVLRTPNVYHFVRFANKIAEIPDEEIEILRQISLGEYSIEVTPSQLQEGDAVRVVSGPLQGIVGKLVRISSERKFILEFQKINRTLIIEMDVNLEKIVTTSASSVENNI